jgi:hypothetical protein
VNDPAVLAGLIAGVIILPILLALVYDLCRRRTSRLRSVVREDIHLGAPFAARDVPVLPSLAQVSTIDLQPTPLSENSPHTREMSATLDTLAASIRPAISSPNRFRAIPPTIAPLLTNSHEQSRPPQAARTVLSPVVPQSDYNRPSSPLRRTIQPPKRKVGSSIRRFPVSPTLPAIPAQQVPSLPDPENQKTAVTPRPLPPLPTVAIHAPPTPTSPVSIATSAFSDRTSLEIHRIQGEFGYIQRIPESTQLSSAASQSSHGTVRPRRLSPIWSPELLNTLETVEGRTRPQR